MYPVAECELTHSNAFELLIATILSAQATDVGVNKATPGLFKEYPTAQALSLASVEQVEPLIATIGLYRTKAKRIIDCAKRLVEVFNSEVPHSVEDLTSLAGVGRKTANVVRSVALDLPGLPVDTHVKRLSNLLDLTDSQDPVVIEDDLCQLLSENHWGEFSLRMILHGRRVCIARRPKCGECSLAELCPSAKVS